MPSIGAILEKLLTDASIDSPEFTKCREQVRFSKDAELDNTKGSIATAGQHL